MSLPHKKLLCQDEFVFLDLIADEDGDGHGYLPLFRNVDA
jgi:hypothetical protein